ncbi:MAG: DNA-directed RNA polymerase subunit beta' [Chloroflexi bacterium]|nr:DNA-directed RNA polymerase subunit beta' [Chloroflexota bacterium]
MAQQSQNEFNAIRIAIASPEQIRTWSYGEVSKPETINYRTLRPEKDGLFCERIFGPTKDWECYCGKYKKIRYKGVICDRCGVEVARSKVRRERMGHIGLAAPVAHIWFSKATPSRLGLLLDISPRNLERVLYFAQYLVMEVNEDIRQSKVDAAKVQLEETLLQLDEVAKAKIEQLSISGDSSENTVSAEKADAESKVEDEKTKESDELNPQDNMSPELLEIYTQLEKDKLDSQLETSDNIDELEDLSVGQLLTESKYRDLRFKHGEMFKAGMGAESILEVLGSLDLDAKRDLLQIDIRSTSGQRRKKLIKSLRIVEAFRKSGNNPEWMIWSVLPVLPPELRPMVQLDGGRFATSDLNDLYRRVINRNNRLKRLIELQAPEIIIRNEKRMLQEAVDALVDNGRRGRAVSGSHNHKLKSLSDLLRGKQGRFRQNLLGKRVDYSGRSVIIVGPTLKLHECGIPRKMALELFKPFVMNQLVVKGYAHNIKSAKRMAERVRPEVWDILENVIKDRPVLLNRAPTLHRLGIQAFKPVLIEGSAIRVHPLVCAAFNADFDGDQMAVHVPLSKEAVIEANQLMLSTKNMLSPSSGEPMVAPTLDIVLGCYYLTSSDDSAMGAGTTYGSLDEARLAFEMRLLNVRAPIKVRVPAELTVRTDASTLETQEPEEGTKFIDTTAGRILINNVIPDELGYWNFAMDKSGLKDLAAIAYTQIGNEEAAKLLDSVKDLGFHYASRSGTTIAISDIALSEDKTEIIQKADKRVALLEQQYLNGLITQQERYTNTVQIWTAANDELTKVIQNNLGNYGGIYWMAQSGAKGNIAQIKQMAGMRGLMSDPKGRIIDRPIKSNFREGLSVLEYFISTHGARKGLADTALRTADSGYLTRRLIDVSQEITIMDEDCSTEAGIWIQEDPDAALASAFGDSLLTRYTASSVADPATGEVILDGGELLDEKSVEKINQSDISQVLVRSPLTCESRPGICRICYGIQLGTGELVMRGEAVGIIAAQSIGEPGTQLTMRTFHTGGIAGADITSGLPRVEELFEARAPKGEAVLSEIDGEVEVIEDSDGRIVRVTNREEYVDEYDISPNQKLLIGNNKQVAIGSTIATPKKTKKSADADNTAIEKADVIARVSGKLKIVGTKAKPESVTIAWEDEEQREYIVLATANVIVQTGDNVVAGQALTSGPKNPQQILRIQGREAVQQYLVDEVQSVYRSQGVKIHDKHIELIGGQMLNKVRIDHLGDTDLLPGELIDRRRYEDVNSEIIAQGGEPASASPVLLGITRASLNMESFLAAASFQETTRVLTESSMNGQVDHLRGLKENVIIGRLIPARLDQSEEGREKLGLPDPSDVEALAEEEFSLAGAMTSTESMENPFEVTESDSKPEES